MAVTQNYNTPIIEEFRANGGKVGGRWEGKDLLLLITTGARSGEERVNPVAYQRLEGGYAVFGSKGGAPTHPDWYYNLLAHPDVTIEVGPDTIPVKARVAQGEERERIWEKQKRLNPNFAAYEEKTSRTIPVIVLEPHD
jgi:deazaflavin-dependent oxidoreductase (nitroreductase family)